MVKTTETGRGRVPIPTRGRSRRVLSILLLVAGVLLLAYVGGSYAWTYGKQRILMRQWEAQNAQPAPTSITPEDSLTRLSIPKINLDVVVVEGTSHQALALGPGHLTNTALPGEPGNAVIAAHRDTFFRQIYQLNSGDDVYVRRGGQQYHYIVTAKRVVLPTDISVLDSTGGSRLTLITCYPIRFIGPAPQRLIVFANLAAKA